MYFGNRYNLAENVFNAEEVFDPNSTICTKNLTSELNTTCFISLKIDDSIKSITYIISINAKGYSNTKTGILHRTSTDLLMAVSLVILSLLFFFMFTLIVYTVKFYNRNGRLPHFFQKFVKTQQVPPGN